MKPDYWDKAKRTLARRDLRLGSIIRSYRGETMQLRGKGFQTLARAIVGQQISVKAADSIWMKVRKAVVHVTPKRVAAAPFDVLRACGLSNAKVLYMHSLADHFLENGKQIKKWPLLEDEAIIQELVSIKGIGRWTAEMFLIFNLLRPNILPLDDVGLLRGISTNYFSGEPVSRSDAREVSANWEPWRTVATWYMWRSLEPVPVEY